MSEPRYRKLILFFLLAWLAACQSTPQAIPMTPLPSMPTAPPATTAPSTATIPSTATVPPTETPEPAPSASPTSAPTSEPTEAVELELGLAGQVGGESYAVVIDGDRAYLGVGPRLVILDVSNSSAPVRVAESPVLPGIVRGIVVAGGFAYVAVDSGGLHIFDVSDGSIPPEWTSVPGGTSAQAAAVQDELAFLAEGECTAEACDGYLRVIDVSEPTQPRELASVEMAGPANDVAVRGDVAYVATDQGLQVVDVSDPAQPRPQDPAVSSYAQDLAIAGSYVYVAGSGVDIVDISDPAEPRLVGSWQFLELLSQAVAVDGESVYLASGECTFGICSTVLHVLDASDPADPRDVGMAGSECGILDLVAADGLVYAAGSACQLAVLDARDPENVQPLGTYDLPGLVTGLAVANSHLYTTRTDAGDLDILRVTDGPADLVPVAAISEIHWAGKPVVAGGHAYVPARYDGLRIFDVSNPAEPREVAVVDAHELQGEPYSVAVQGDYAYVAVAENGLRVVDVAQPDSPRLAGSYDAPGSGIGLDVVVAGGRAYIAGSYDDGEEDREGLLVVDVGDPANLRGIGSLALPGPAVGVAVNGSYAYVAAGDLHVVDVSTPEQPSLVSSLDLKDDALDVVLEGEGGVPASAADSAYVAVGRAGVYLVDVSDPSAPRFVSSFDTPGSAESIATDARHVYVADGAGGVVILLMHP